VQQTATQEGQAQADRRRLCISCVRTDAMPRAF